MEPVKVGALRLQARAAALAARKVRRLTLGTPGFGLRASGFDWHSSGAGQEPEA